MKKHILFTACAFLLCTSVFAQQAKLHILRDFLGGATFGISSDGKYATGGIESLVGFRYDIKNEAWIAFGDDRNSCGRAVSNDGTVVGIGNDSTFSPVIESGFIWQNSTFTYLGIRPTSNPEPFVGSLPYCITADTRTIVGSTPVITSELAGGNPPVYNVACVWDNKPGNITVSALTGSNPNGMGSRAESVSDNGKVICGHINSDVASEAVVWINRENPISLSFSDLENNYGSATSVSQNARFVTGNYENGVSFLWDAFKQDTLYRIDSPTTAYMANGVSSGGTIIGYQCGFAAPGRPINNPLERVGMIKLLGEEPQDIEVFLENRGIYVMDEGVRLTTPICISNDGRIIAGLGWDDVKGGMVPFIVDLGESLDKGDLTPYDPIDSTINNETIHTQVEKVSIYPNPAQDILNIEGDHNQVHIFDISGRKVFYSATPCKSISLTKFKRGIYFVKFEGKTGSQTSKLIIQ